MLSESSGNEGEPRCITPLTKKRGVLGTPLPAPLRVRRPEPSGRELLDAPLERVVAPHRAQHRDRELLLARLGGAPAVTGA